MKTVRYLTALFVLWSLTSCLEIKEEKVVDSSVEYYQAWGLAFDSSQRLFITDRVHHKIKLVDLAANTTSDFAGSGVQGNVDANGTNAQFSYPNGLAIDSNNNLYVGDWSYAPQYLSRVRKITPSGDVSTVATLPSNTFGYIESLAVDSSGNIFVATTYQIWKISNTGVVTTFAGSNQQGDNTDGNGSAASFFQITDMKIDPSDNLWVTTPSALAGLKLRKVDTSANVTTISSVAGGTSLSYANGFLYILSATADIIKYDIANSTSSVILSNAFSTASGGQASAINSIYGGLCLQYDEYQVKCYPIP